MAGAAILLAALAMQQQGRTRQAIADSAAATAGAALALVLLPEPATSLALAVCVGALGAAVVVVGALTQHRDLTVLAAGGTLDRLGRWPSAPHRQRHQRTHPDPGGHRPRHGGSGADRLLSARWTSGVRLGRCRVRSPRADGRPPGCRRTRGRVVHPPDRRDPADCRAGVAAQQARDPLDDLARPRRSHGRRCLRRSPAGRAPWITDTGGPTTEHIVRLVLVLSLCGLAAIVGARLRLAGLFWPAVVALVIAGAAELWGSTHVLPRWVVLAVVGAALLLAGARIEWLRDRRTRLDRWADHLA